MSLASAWRAPALFAVYRVTLRGIQEGGHHAEKRSRPRSAPFPDRGIRCRPHAEAGAVLAARGGRPAVDDGALRSGDEGPHRGTRSEEDRKLVVQLPNGDDDRL